MEEHNLYYSNVTTGYKYVTQEIILKEIFV